MRMARVGASRGHRTNACVRMRWEPARSGDAEGKKVGHIYIAKFCRQRMHERNADLPNDAPPPKSAVVAGAVRYIRWTSEGVEWQAKRDTALRMMHHPAYRSTCKAVLRSQAPIGPHSKFRSPRSGPRSARRTNFGVRPDRGTREAPLWG